MLNWLRNWRKTEEEQTEERISAYVDGALTAVEKRAFEREMAANSALQEAVEAEQALKTTLSQLPRLRAPRNFTLDTAVYGQQKRPTLAMQLYPRLRTATAVVGLLLVGIIALNFLAGPANPSAAPESAVALFQQESEQTNQAPPSPAEVQTTRVVTEIVTDEVEPAADAEQTEMADGLRLSPTADSAAMTEMAGADEGGEQDEEAMAESIIVEEEEMAEEAADMPPAEPMEAETGAAETVMIPATAVPQATATVMPLLPQGGAADSSPRVEPTATLPPRLLPTAVPTAAPTAKTPAPQPPAQDAELTNLGAGLDLWFVTQSVFLLAFLILLVATFFTRRRL